MGLLSKGKIGWCEARVRGKIMYIASVNLKLVAKIILWIV